MINRASPPTLPEATGPTRGGAPEHLRADNGPEMIAWALRDYCRLAGTTTSYIEPGSPGRTRSWSPSTGDRATSY